MKEEIIYVSGFAVVIDENRKSLFLGFGEKGLWDICGMAHILFCVAIVHYELVKGSGWT